MVILSVKEKVEELEEKVNDLTEDVTELKADLQILRERIAGEGEEEDKEKLVTVSEKEEEPVKAFPDLEKREQEIEDQVYEYVKESGGLTSITACARELGVDEKKVKTALVQLKLKGKIEF